ncbi:MAG: hypothetical protein INR64_15770 [Caulobacteraceae bacterium]|nr:hypothetical protein [Caulobacter sp.]
MTSYRQWFRIDNVQAPRPRGPADGAFHLIVTAPYEPRLVELLLSDFFGQHGLIGTDSTDMVEATSGGGAPAYGRVEVICPLQNAALQVERYAERARVSAPKAMILMLAKRRDAPGENLLHDVDRLAAPLEPLGATFLYQCDLRPNLPDSYVLLVVVPHEAASGVVEPV